MSPTPAPNPEENLFSRALALPPAERGAFLARECAGDAALRARIETLLRAEDDGSFMTAPAADLTLPPFGAARFPEEKPGDRIGRYKLLQKIGEGGCGRVYVAEQQEPVVRRVALKVIKLGMDTKEVMARFEAERQALALMDHPNIARVFDAGATDTGRPFFVMELVRGVPLTKYCDDQNLPTAARLDLFVHVCHAIQHAHQKGIIHRDLKPSNLLVTENDGRPVPKVIDFGIAKATQGRLTEATVFTAFEQFIGTPAYMSPEQAALTSLDIDTRSDIYSLGVLLYELLTGRPPFDPKSLVASGLDEIRRVIREVDPPRPSNRLATLADPDRVTVAKQRGTAPAQLTTQLRGDLDWIVMRCLEKDRTRRYETATSLAQDIQRHLHNEPVAARPASTAYRIQKAIQRNKLAFAGGTIVAIAVLAGAGIATWQAVRATRAEEAATAEAEKSRRASDFLKTIFGEIGPSVLKGRDTALLNTMLDQATQRVPAALPGQPEVQIDLYYTIGWAYYSLSEYGKAEAAFRSGVDLTRKQNDPVRLAYWLDQLAMAVLDGGDAVRAEPMLQEALTLVRPLRGQPEADDIRHDLLRVLCSAQQKRGHYLEAAATGRELLASQRESLGRDEERTIRTLYTNAAYENQAGNLALSETMLREALELRRPRRGKPGMAILDPMIDVAGCLVEHGAFDQAEPLLNEATTILRAQLKPNATNRWAMLGSLASVWAQRGNLTLAENLYREHLAVAQQEFSPNNTFVGLSHLRLAGVLRRRGDREAAQAESQKALEIIERTFGRKGRHVPATLETQARLLSDLARYDEAEALCRDALAARRDNVGEENAYLLPSLGALAQVQAARGNPTAAIATNREQLRLCRQHLGPRHPNLVAILLTLADNLVRHGDFQEAEASLAEAWTLEQSLGYLRHEKQRDLRKSHEQLYAGWIKTDPAKAPRLAEWQAKVREFEQAAQP